MGVNEFPLLIHAYNHLHKIKKMPEKNYPAAFFQLIWQRLNFAC